MRSQTLDPQNRNEISLGFPLSRTDMVGGTQQQQPQQLNKFPSTSATTPTAAAATSADEEFVKANTDCVYFLASPLTCKKGSECEYRHSEIARVNPRDCWYWVNATCLNPKCAFRHPPLDGFLGVEGSTPTGPSVSQLQAPVKPATQGPHAFSKQGVPCIFFQKGYCLKGDRCPFFHAPFSRDNNKVAQSASTDYITEPPTVTKAFEKSVQEQSVPQITNVPKSVQLPANDKSTPKIQVAPVRDGVVIHNTAPLLPSSMDSIELPRYRPNIVPPASSEIFVSKSRRAFQSQVSDTDSVPNGKHLNEFSREASPGFDVLVDDELGDSECYRNEERFGRSGHHEGRNTNTINDYDISRSAKYNSVANIDRGLYRDQHDYESHEQQSQGEQYSWEEHRISSERMLGERRRYPTAERPDQHVSDLRHRISKQRRGDNGLRSVISCDQPHESHPRDSVISRREKLNMQESSLSTRLRGRIKVPGRSTSPVCETSDREMDMERHLARYSSPRPHIITSNNHSRFRDRIKGRVHEDFIIDRVRDFRGDPHTRRDVSSMNGTEIDFAGPKRLSELKNAKAGENYDQQANDPKYPKTGKAGENYEQKANGPQYLEKRKYQKLESHQQSEDDLSFEGPKPLSEILKRKRGVETIALVSDHEDYNNSKERMDRMTGDKVSITSKEEKGPVSSELGGAGKGSDFINSEKEKVKSSHVQSSVPQEDVNELENEGGLIADETMDDQETAVYNDREGDSDYENVDGEDYYLDEVENRDPEEEYLDDNDADDFAKKMGVVYS